MKSQMIALWGKTMLGMLAVGFVSVGTLASANAAEKKKDASPAAKEDAGSTAEEMDAYYQQGPAVHVKKDGKGRLEKVIVVGRARISTVLGAAKGKEMARKKAAQNAKAEFVKWLGEKVEVREKSENEATLFLTGAEENGKDSLERGWQGRREEQRLLQVRCGRACSRLDGASHGRECRNRGENLYLGVRMDAANAKAAKHTATNDSGIDDKPAGASAKEPPGGKATSEKKIRSRKVTSKEAEDFLK